VDWCLVLEWKSYRLSPANVGSQFEPHTSSRLFNSTHHDRIQDARKFQECRFLFRFPVIPFLLNMSRESKPTPQPVGQLPSRRRGSTKPSYPSGSNNLHKSEPSKIMQYQCWDFLNKTKPCITKYIPTEHHWEANRPPLDCWLEPYRNCWIIYPLTGHRWRRVIPYFALPVRWKHPKLSKNGITKWKRFRSTSPSSVSWSPSNLALISQAAQARTLRFTSLAWAARSGPSRNGCGDSKGSGGFLVTLLAYPWLSIVGQGFFGIFIL
jgi:hypothetical protein